MATRRQEANGRLHVLDDMPPHRQCRHTFEVHITGVPTGSPDPEYRWHGDFEHRHKGKRVSPPYKSSPIEELLKALVARIRRIVE